MIITTPHIRPHLKQKTLSNLSVAGVDLSKLVLYSTFDNDSRVSDITGNENHGTFSGAFIDGKGRYGKSVFLDSTNDTITFANENNFDIGASEDFTIWFWFKIHTIGVSVILSKGAVDPFYDVIFSGGAAPVVTFETQGGAGVITAGAGGAGLVAEKWHCITCVFNRATNTSNLYVDGTVHGGTGDISTVGAISNASSFIIGHPTNSPGSNIDIIGFAKQAFDIPTIQNLCRMGL